MARLKFDMTLKATLPQFHKVEASVALLGRRESNQWLAGNSTECVGEPKPPLQHAVVKNGPRVRVEGARRVWGTMKHTTTKTIGNAISCFYKIEDLKIKRKVRSNPSTQKQSWWFVIHADEVLLNELESNWTPLICRPHGYYSIALNLLSILA